MTPIHLNRVLKKLRASGAMTLTRGNLLVTDPEKLVRIAGFDENDLHRRLRRAAAKFASGTVAEAEAPTSFCVDKRRAARVHGEAKLLSSAMTREEMIAEAERHVRQGENRIFSQQQVILDLASCGATTALACELLELLQDMQSVHVDHLEQLRQVANQSGHSRPS